MISADSKPKGISDMCGWLLLCQSGCERMYLMLIAFPL